MVAADCVTPGVEVYICSLCDEVKTVETETDPTAHAFWGEEEILTEASCVTKTNGLKKVHCANEGCTAVEEYEIFYSEVHAWDVQTDVYPTCTEDGAYYAVCTLCSEVESYTKTASGHYNWYMTCGNTGNCMECGQEFTLEHNLEMFPATCTDPATCFNCWEPVGEALGHTFINGMCHCGEEYVAPTTGDWTLVTELKNGDLVLIGNPAYGKLLSATKTGFYNVGVDYAADSFANVTDAEIFVVTVNADGTYTFTSLTGDVMALAASYASLNVDGEHKSWTLESKGDGTFLIKNVGRNTYLEWYSSKNNWSTYNAGNTTEYYLSFYVRSASSEDHVHNHITEEHEASCTVGSYTSYTCSCGDTYTVEGTEPATGHTYTETVVAPTCTEAGYTAFTCACGDTYTVEGTEPATGHTYTETVVAPTCTEAGYTVFTCACGDTYTADGEPATGHTFVDGKCECGEEELTDTDPVLGGSADFNTIELPSSKPKGDSSYTNSYTTADGWVTEYSAIQCGGATDMNPQFTVIGPDTNYKAVCLNGKTSAPGKITSPTLTGGLSKLTVNFTKIFTDTELSVTVTVTELSTGNEYTYVIARTLEKNEKYQVYTEVWTLELPVNGDFTITIVNNCPTGQDGNKDRFTVLSIDWEGAPEVHVHNYEVTETTATCTTAGVNTLTCSCGDSYTEQTDKLGHVDANLDVDCDREGCTGKVAPAADTVLSTFTANNLGSKLSTSGSYYVEGTIVEVLDARNGVFLIDDGSGETFYFRLPKDADGVSHANWTVKLVLGDVVRLYGKINKFSSTDAPNGQYWPAMQGCTVEYIAQHAHVFGEPTCTDPGYCVCGQDGPVALGHNDADGDDLCDVCTWNVKLAIEQITTKYNDVKDTDKVDTTVGTALFEGTEFNVTFNKGTSSFNKNGTDHMRLNNGNQIVVSTNGEKKIAGLVFVATSESYVDELELYLQAVGYEYTVNGTELTVMLEECESVTIANTSGKSQRIAAVHVIYFNA